MKATPFVIEYLEEVTRDGRLPRSWAPAGWAAALAERRWINPDFVLGTPAQAEDAAANALARLFCVALARQIPGNEGGGGFPPDTFTSPGFTYIVAACRELLRGPLDQDWTYQAGGYCMRSPTDPTLRALSHFGASLVELAYTTRPDRALAEADELWVRLRKEIDDAVSS
jgi:hypothetical protein